MIIIIIFNKTFFYSQFFCIFWNEEKGLMHTKPVTSNCFISFQKSQSLSKSAVDIGLSELSNKATYLTFSTICRSEEVLIETLRIGFTNLEELQDLFKY